MDYFERLKIEQRLREIDESWGDMNMSLEEAEATKKEYDELYLQLHPEVAQARAAQKGQDVAPNGWCSNCGISIDGNGSCPACG